MSPQPSIQQLDHAIKNLETLVEAKGFEIESYALLRDHAPAAFESLTKIYPADALPDLSRSLGMLGHATVNLFAAKHTVATIELEELQMMLAARRQQRSGIVGAGMIIPPFNSKRQ
jgi:hypothetical protein